MNRGYSHNSGFSSSGLNPVALVALFLMLACFGIAAFYFISQTKPTEDAQVSAPSPQFDVVDVLVAVDKIDAGIALEPILFRKESRASLSVGPSRVSSYDQLKGAYSASFIAAGQPLLSEYVTFRKPVNQVQANIPDGYRAVSIAVDETTSVEGWARAGAKVDVLLTSTVNGRSTATVIVQNAKVLSGGGAEERKEKGERVEVTTVTLMVTVEEATKIQLASNEAQSSSGSLSLVLRGDEDTIESPTNSSISLESILNGENGNKPTEIPPEGSITIDGRVFLIVRGRLVPQNKDK